MKRNVSFQSLILGSLYISLLVLMLGILGITIWQKHQFLEEHLAQASRDAATSLALSVSTVARDGDWVTASSMIDVLFDSGAYADITLEDRAGNKVFSRQRQLELDEVPGWFIWWVDLEGAPQTAEVMAGWTPQGRITVSVYPAAAWVELWRSLVSLGIWFVLTGIAAGLLFRYFLLELLRPLHRLSEVAQRIRKKDFSQRLEHSYIQELQEVSEAVNLMSERLGSVFTQQIETIDTLRRLSMMDSVTGLQNRRTFDTNLQALLDSEEKDATGHLLLLQLDHFNALNQTLGRNAGDSVLAAVASLIEDEARSADCQVITGRREGAQFVVFLSSGYREKAVAFAERLIERVEGLPELNDEALEQAVTVNAGLAGVSARDRVSDAFTATDQALREAQAQAPGRVEVHEPATFSGESRLVIPAGQWRDLIERAVDARSFKLFYQPTLRPGDHSVYFHQILLRMPHQEQVLTAGEFLPWAERFGKMADIDSWVLQQVLDRMTLNPEDGAMCVSLSAATLSRTGVMQEFSDFFENYPVATEQLLIEIPEYSLRQSWSGMDQLILLRKQYGFRIVVSRFGMSGIPFGYLETWPVDMIKLDPGLVRQIDKSNQHQFYVRNIAQIAHSRDVKLVVTGIERKEEAQALQSLGIDGVSGFFICRPQAQPVHFS